ncbi:hypothetical protein Dda_4267 [Drechslerella dactyloides]|uniref:Uncharacterized protein n=1 Tax=Drechslerella dactyloides TaxID=74499 RepID=A0AAD6J3V7_DREDA|nr:hypothetical protein Dda_4267 [Drechslerella dactyloides]
MGWKERRKLEMECAGGQPAQAGQRFAGAGSVGGVASACGRSEPNSHVRAKTASKVTFSVDGTAIQQAERLSTRSGVCEAGDEALGRVEIHKVESSCGGLGTLDMSVA